MMPSRTFSDSREDAVRMLCDMIALASASQGTTAVIRLLSWIDAREEDEGGFLWLAGVLSYRPSQLEHMIRSTLDANPRRRRAIDHRLTMIYWKALNG